MSRDYDVDEIICGNGGVLENVKPGSIIVDLSTTSKDLALRMKEQLQDQQCFYLDAPVSGGEAGASKQHFLLWLGVRRIAIRKLHLFWIVTQTFINTWESLETVNLLR